MTTAILTQVAELPTLPTPKLKAMWRELTGTEPPPYNRTFLVKRLAYRIQELAFGGLSVQAERRLDDLVDELDGKKKPKTKDMTAPIVGTKLIREWQGVLQEVTALADGFEWQGRRYQSLSAVARAITGTRWNGPLFFGLRKHGKLETSR
ncbi:DUF2924 domain-containing protein [Magnetospirillum gryphiswaldense]|uniref:Bacteriophage-related protein n=1 Tax=Magnetospirillum gryphiswaldense TaxID=55518 RepID=A4TZ85_9PROT|nr:DUF2924 domain-containing protein [Magnetospirillum gryphiswaldense]AVM76236.1 hypothetical protein MSR1_37780 [Magnetospirillum gryphiswaldense MSR-1]AVM80139.1 hypothetical protein MSR1L_37780 [Magnetospirillum gryphiswaldense]CAM75942.1 bacteriophage-related protein [Magnetospirillum gryphiswaldense MSR-1]